MRIGKKYFTTSDCNKFTSYRLDAKITQKKFVSESKLDEKKSIRNKSRIESRAR